MNRFFAAFLISSALMLPVASMAQTKAQDEVPVREGRRTTRNDRKAALAATPGTKAPDRQAARASRSSTQTARQTRRAAPPVSGLPAPTK
jgi:hypothetical protein